MASFNNLSRQKHQIQIFELDNPLKLQVTNASKCAPPNDNCPKNNRHWLTLLSSVVHSGGLPPRPSDELKTIKYHFQSEPEPKMCLFLFINTIYWLTWWIGETLGPFWDQFEENGPNVMRPRWKHNGVEDVPQWRQQWQWRKISLTQKCNENQYTRISEL